MPGWLRKKNFFLSSGFNQSTKANDKPDFLQRAFKLVPIKKLFFCVLGGFLNWKTSSSPEVIHWFGTSTLIWEKLDYLDEVLFHHCDQSLLNLFGKKSGACVKLCRNVGKQTKGVSFNRDRCRLCGIIRKPCGHM